MWHAQYAKARKPAVGAWCSGITSESIWEDIHRYIAESFPVNKQENRYVLIAMGYLKQSEVNAILNHEESTGMDANRSNSSATSRSWDSRTATNTGISSLGSFRRSWWANEEDRDHPSARMKQRNNMIRWMRSTCGRSFQCTRDWVGRLPIFLFRLRATKYHTTGWHQPAWCSGSRCACTLQTSFGDVPDRDKKQKTTSYCDSSIRVKSPSFSHPRKILKGVHPPMNNVLYQIQRHPRAKITVVHLYNCRVWGLLSTSSL